MSIIDYIRQAFFLRSPILFGLILFLMGPFFLSSPLRRLLSNVLLLHNMSQVAALTAVCLISATLLASQFSLIVKTDRTDSGVIGIQISQTLVSRFPKNKCHG